MKNFISNIMENMITYFDGDVRRINHATKVYGFAKTIGENEDLSDEKLTILETAAVLHDIGIKVSERKYNSSAGKYQELEGPDVALEILDKFNLAEKFKNRVAYLIGHHHTYNVIDDIDFQILVEADFLVNIYEDELAVDNIKIVRDKYFKTKTGTMLLNSMYLKK